jgi:hypothetical protein
VHPSVPVKTVPEFIAYAKANPGKINMASGGIGSGNHIAGTRDGSCQSTSQQTNSATASPGQWVCRGCPWLVIDA